MELGDRPIEISGGAQSEREVAPRLEVGHLRAVIWRDVQLRRQGEVRRRAAEHTIVHERIDRVVLEAFAAGTPVVASDIEGYAAVAGPETGLDVAGGDPLQIGRERGGEGVRCPSRRGRLGRRHAARALDPRCRRASLAHGRGRHGPRHDGVALEIDGDASDVAAAISEKTVRNHVSALFDKLGVWTRAQAIVFALDRGFRDRWSADNAHP